MSIINRRKLLRATSLALTAFSIGACATAASAPTVAAQVVADANIIATALQAILPALQAATGGNTVQAAAVANDVEAVVAAATGLTISVSRSTGASIVSRIGAAFATILTSLSGFGLSAPEQTVLSAIQTLLPVVEVAVGVAVASGFSSASMTPAQARVVLAGAVKK